MILYSITFSMPIGMLWAKFTYGDTLVKRYRMIVMLKMMAFATILNLGWVMWEPLMQPQNRGIYAAQTIEKRTQDLLEYKFDLYRNVDKLMYTDKRISNKEKNQKIEDYLKVAPFCKEIGVADLAPEVVEQLLEKKLAGSSQRSHLY
eukprot:TRINITY_DN5226_c0_g1_i15.p2 TRINITY_DN5226_c0_g1~~TRINITY_DN5226_c0_g1_i15.p2  ORF type:complete len:147 (-),score=32.55 TRINITY_DN5226_c0_g1_i15:228-668(-)